MINHEPEKAGGAGLGLALCLEIARLHGARLQIESESRKGTCVSIIFDKKGGDRMKPRQKREKKFHVIRLLITLLISAAILGLGYIFNQ